MKKTTTQQQKQKKQRRGEKRQRPAEEEDDEVAKCEAEVEERKAAVARRRDEIDRLQRELAEKKAALEEDKRALETAVKALTAAKALTPAAVEETTKELLSVGSQKPAAVEASGHFAMLSDFEILEILRCFVPSSRQAHVFDVCLICSFAATCRRLHVLAFSPEIWRSFDPGAVFGSIKDSTLRKLCAAPWISACERLFFDIFNYSQITLVERMPNLRELRVFLEEEVGDEVLKRLASALSSLQHLRKLNLIGSSPGVLRFFRLEDSPVESLVLESCDSSLPIDGRVFPHITELRLVDLEDEELIARAFPNLRKLDTNGDLGAFWKHCHHLEDVTASRSSHPCIDALATSPCSQTLRRFIDVERVDCTELARASPNLVAVNLGVPTNIAGLAGLAHLQELELQKEDTFEELNELGERARGMRLKKLTLLNYGDGGEADLTRFFGSPCCSQLEVLDVGDFSIDSCIAGLASQSDPLPLRSFEPINSFVSRHCPSSLSVLLAKCPALTDIHLFCLSAGEIAQSLGTTPSIAPVLKISASLKNVDDLLAVGNVFGRTLQVVKFIDIDDQAAIDAFVASCPHLKTIHFGSRIKQLPRLPPWITAKEF